MVRPARHPDGRRAHSGPASRGTPACSAVCSAGVGVAGARDAVLSAWASSARVWVHLAAVIAGFAVIVIATLALPGARTRPGVYLSSALADPLRDFFTRYRSAAGLILALICLYRIPDFVLNIMNPFYLDLGYTLVEIAEIRKIFGVGMTMLGVFVGRAGRRALRSAAGDGDRRLCRPPQQSPVHLAGPAGAQPAGAVRGHRSRQRRRRDRRHVLDRLHVEPDVDRVHGHPVRSSCRCTRSPAG